MFSVEGQLKLGFSYVKRSITSPVSSWTFGNSQNHICFKTPILPTLSENHTPRPTSQLFSLLRHSLWIRKIPPRDVLFSQSFMSSLAPWLSWLKRLSSKQEIPSSNLGGASLFFLPSFPIIPHCLHLDLSCSYCPFSACQPG